MQKKIEPCEDSHNERQGNRGWREEENAGETTPQLLEKVAERAGFEPAVGG